MRLKLLVLSFVAVIGATLCHATSITPYYIVTGQIGAQTQTDVEHTTVWYPSSIVPPVDAGSLHYTNVLLTDLDPAFDWYLGGADLDMKAGPSASADVILILWDVDIVSAIDSVSLGPGSFSTASFNPVQFHFTNPHQLLSGHHYFLTLTSDAADSQDEAYFIKPEDSVIQEANGGSPQGGGSTQGEVVPEPASWTLIAGGIGLVLATRLRRARR